jgi:hypothetical protein
MTITCLLLWYFTIFTLFSRKRLNHHWGLRARCTTLCGKVCQWLAAGWWFSPGTPVSSTNKTDSHDITEILLKVALNIINHYCSNQMKNKKYYNKVPIMYYSEKTTDLLQVTNKLYHKCCTEYTSSWTEFELTTCGDMHRLHR